jgi:hypothetical protein
MKLSDLDTVIVLTKSYREYKTAIIEIDNNGTIIQTRQQSHNYSIPIPFDKERIKNLLLNLCEAEIEAVGESLKALGVTLD